MKSLCVKELKMKKKRTKKSETTQQMLLYCVLCHQRKNPERIHLEW